MEKKKYCTAIVLAAGSGKRMGTKVHKQYLLMGGKPVLYYSLRAFQESRSGSMRSSLCAAPGRGRVLPPGDRGEVRHDLKYAKIIPGGAERYHFGLERPPGDKRTAMSISMTAPARSSMEEMIARAYECVSAVPVHAWPGCRRKIRSRSQILTRRR